MLLVWSSCVTTKKKDEVGKIGKMYHDITSKYNRNFNANVLIDESLAQLETNYQEDYSKILPLYPVLVKENATQLAEPMDRAIEKASVAISIHRPSHWTDDNYMIIGRAQFLKEDYESAEATFRYLIKHYDPKNIISASAPKSRNMNAKLSEKEKVQEKKEAEKDREIRVKEREREIKAKQKERKKQAKARMKDRKKQIQERKKKSSSSSSKQKDVRTEDTADPKKDTKPKKDKNKQEPFEEDPKLPKIKGNPDNYFMKHKPAHQEAQLWLAKTLIERDRYGEAENILRALDSKETTFSEVREEIYPVMAHSSLSRGQMSSSIEPLKTAIEAASNRSRKARYAFVLAQVAELNNNYQQAEESYDLVTKLKPNYTMTFNAELSKLKMQARTGSVDPERYANQLNRMIKDDNNRDYRDQLYYALAMQNLKNGQKKEAIENLSQSIRNSTGNAIQKSESYYTIADLYYADEDYVNAKYYFDSTLTVMTASDPRHEEVSAFAKNLTKIAMNLEVIELQDSLLKISELPEKELKELAIRLKKEAAKAEAAARAAAAVAAIPKTNLSTLNTATSAFGKGGTTFFAYDDKNLKKGQRDFSREWGDVALVDNWRRSNSASFELLNAGESGDSAVVNTNLSETEVDEILKGVPKSDAEKAASRKKVEDALFALGQLFRSELGNTPKSIGSLETLLDRFPKTEHALDAYYLLFVSHSELAHVSEAEYYSKKVSDDYSDSEYARYIKDPSYLRDAKSDEEKVEEYYENAHMLFTEGNVDEALKRLLLAKSELPKQHALLSKFSLLTALCTGRVKGREAYVNALKEVIAKYPNTKEEERAKEIIRLLGIRFTESSEGIEEINPDSYFTLSEKDKLHLIIVALKQGAEGKDLNSGRIAISDYNKKYHRLDKLTVSTIVLGEDKDLPVCVIRRFDTKEKAMAYYDGVQKNIKDFIGDPNLYEIFATSQTNYRKIVQLNSMDLYREFFVQEYLTK